MGMIINVHQSIRSAWLVPKRIQKDLRDVEKKRIDKKINGLDTLDYQLWIISKLYFFFLDQYTKK
ncbi:hypothetical protein M0804_009415 [Polistes exclamans]|nr:hypothetical protein M0804_009415 [Polistes exclamans]